MGAKTASPPRWVWWLLGCSFVGGFLLFCGCGVLGFWGYRLFQQHALPHLTWEQVQQLVPDLPVYPNAQFSEQLTNFPLYRLMPKMSAELKDRGERLLLIAFRTSDPPSKVLEWYRRTLVQQGWWEEETRELAQAHPLLQKTVNPFRRRFWKGNSLLMFRALDAHHFVLGCSLPGLFPWEMKELEEQVQRQPQDGEAWAQLAWGYLCIAQWDKAREAALKAASHPPEKVSLKALLAETLLELAAPLQRSRPLSGKTPDEDEGSLAVALHRLPCWNETVCGSGKGTDKSDGVMAKSVANPCLRLAKPSPMEIRAEGGRS